LNFLLRPAITVRNESFLVRHTNSGQAILEALVVISFGILFLFGIHSIGMLRSQTLDLLGKSVFLSYLRSNEIPSDSHRVVSLESGVYAPVLQTVSQELGVKQMHISRTSASGIMRTTSLYQTIHPILSDQFERHSFLISGSGRSVSNAATQNAIANAPTLWQKSFSESKNTVTRHALQSQRVDDVWSRSKVSTDWLLPWANEFGASNRLSP
jgi:hypothetical protein